MRRLLLVLTAFALLAPAAASAHRLPPPRPAVLALNLCNSGYAGCYATLNQGQALPEAVRLLRERRPAVVTLNEVCVGDLRRLTRETGYRGVFSPSGTQGCDPADHPEYTGEDLRYGNVVAVAPGIRVDRVEDPVTYAGQDGLREQRTVRCLRALGVRACVTHLVNSANNRAQATELRGLLQTWAQDGPVLLGGDLNLRAADAAALALPAGWSARDDGEVMHVLASPAFRLAPARITPLTRTDHPALEVALRPAR